MSPSIFLGRDFDNVREFPIVATHRELCSRASYNANCKLAFRTQEIQCPFPVARHQRSNAICGFQLFRSKWTYYVTVQVIGVKSDDKSALGARIVRNADLVFEIFRAQIETRVIKAACCINNPRTSWHAESD